mmetsp:Transcript_66545/g.124147  ORF Transcript_66545/g.124147 Transcript_66545/m.124147 type:complete len:200 (-) Transcript_66545:91-690(-)
MAMATSQATDSMQSRFCEGPVAKFSGELPWGGVFTLDELSHWDGVELPMCIGLCGKVLDVSASPNFRPGEGYGKLWAGKDATYSLATMSLAPDAASTMDWRLEDLTDMQRSALTGWWRHFQSKYPVVGTLKEFSSWDFDAIASKAMQPDAPAAPFEGAAEAGGRRPASLFSPRTMPASGDSESVRPTRGKDGRLHVSGL